MIYKVRFLEPTKIEVKNILRYYVEINPDLEKRFKEEYYRTIEILETTPFIFPKIYRNFRRTNLVIFPYSIFYIIRVDEVLITSVVHQSRDPKVWKSKKLN